MGKFLGCMLKLKKNWGGGGAGRFGGLGPSQCRKKKSVNPGLEVIKLEFILRLKIKHNDWLLPDTCPHAANHCALFHNLEAC